ncbi:hypothetical protein ACFLZQ_08620, partial [Thermodesulfobacteriota bacterium]
MEIVSYGTIDIPEKKLTLQVLVAPLQIVNKIQKMLPVIRTILPTSITAVTVEVSGDFSDIKVRTLSMSAMSTRVFGVRLRISFFVAACSIIWKKRPAVIVLFVFLSIFPGPFLGSSPF